jgi:hypothetical protein
MSKMVFENKRGPYIVVLRREDDNLIELREIGKEIVNPRAFCCAPAILALYVVFSTTLKGEWGRRKGKDARLLTSQVLVTNKSSIESNNV